MNYEMNFFFFLHLVEDVGNSRVWVGSGIEHCSGSSQRGDEEGSSDCYDDDCPCWEYGLNEDGTLLISVGEVVVPGRHVVELSGVVHLDESTIKVCWGGIQLEAIFDVLVCVVLIAVILG